MRIYVCSTLADTALTQEVQQRLVAAGHEVTHDWAADTSVNSGFAEHAERAARMAQAELAGVLAADAVLVLATEHDGRGMFVELGAALARAERGEDVQVVLVGEVVQESVFYWHPRVRRSASVDAWIAENPAGGVSRGGAASSP